MDDEIVFLDGDYAIIRSDRLFESGFNCYRATPSASKNFIKINNRFSFFTTFDAAMEWLKTYRK